MLNIWGRISSINVRKVVWCAQELGLDFQRTEAGGKYGVVQTPEYLALNPNAMVPAISDDDGFVLWESNVIVRYLCAKHWTWQLYPERLPERFDAERWMDWQQTTLNRASGPAFVQWVRTPAERRDAAAIEASVRATEPLLHWLDAHLARCAACRFERSVRADFHAERSSQEPAWLSGAQDSTRSGVGHSHSAIISCSVVRMTRWVVVRLFGLPVVPPE